MAPASKLEEQLQAVWQEVLGQERVSTQSDFFTIGGNSLQARRTRYPLLGTCLSSSAFLALEDGIILSFGCRPGGGSRRTR